ncbi:hypothetical protein CJO92_00065 [Ralstonia solanacearum]|uniref:Uncharacterized protein n=1 Tax=Ralstonia solanacearum TaxID=305 RepID=A0AAD0WEU5_RALSL|nr:hypothetical protein CJO77_00065 [Ralstonia solanacearum]AXW51227.1 hypothetical protein CJO92_00065 [Ralstonia solanacearum]CBJ49394.1 hypothethical protein [Ralstonia solanacearum PSI07]
MSASPDVCGDAGQRQPRVPRHTGAMPPQNSLPALVPLLVIQHTMAPLQHGQLGSAVAGLDCSLGAACTERGASCGPD